MVESAIPKQHVVCICGHRVKGVTGVVEVEEEPERTSIYAVSKEYFWRVPYKVECVSRDKWMIIGSERRGSSHSVFLSQKYKTRSIVALSHTLIPSSLFRFTMVKAVVLGAAGQYSPSSSIAPI